jgi:sugar phosphate isomerase/epimerase
MADEKRDNYHISDIYQGGYSSFSPTYGDVFTGYRTNAESIGLAIDPRTANILQETSAKLATGIKQIEVSQVQPDVFESIPKQHFQEVKRLAKLTGVDVSLHAPIVEPSGVSKDGFSEENREGVQRQMFSAVEKSHELNPDGNIPVTFHSSAMIPQPVTPKGKEFPSEVFVINTESGSMNKIPLEESYFTGEKTNIKNELGKINEKVWQNSLSRLSYNYERGSELVAHYIALALPAKAEKAMGREITGEKERAIATFNAATAILNDSYRELKEVYDKAYKYSNDEQRNQLNELRKKIGTSIKEVEKEKDPTSSRGIELRQEIIGEGFETLNRLFPLGTGPEVYRPLDEFAKEKTTETFANVALESFKKFGGKSPIISIENPPAGGAFSTAEELKDVVEKARQKFVEKAMKSGMSKSQAEQAAEKTIGVTWDVGHINMLRKYGYGKEELIKQAEIVAPLVKHVHLSDNFGFEHTELPMGMGNVPIKEILEQLGKEGFEGTKVIEAGNWWQHFKTPPVKETLEAFGSPIYSMNMAPYWNQAIGFGQGYYSGQGPTLPQVNYETFGGGFSQLPAELGGQKQSAEGSRMSGKKME